MANLDPHHLIKRNPVFPPCEDNAPSAAWRTLMEEPQYGVTWDWLSSAVPTEGEHGDIESHSLMTVSRVGPQIMKVKCWV